MLILLSGTADSYAQLITVLLAFVLVLGVTAVVTKWLAGYQKQQSANSNVEVIETTRITANKYIQIVRIGDTYKAIAVCKDTITLLGEVPKEQLKSRNLTQGSMNFKEFLEHSIKKDSGNQS